MATILKNKKPPYLHNGLTDRSLLYHHIHYAYCFMQ